MMGYTDASGSCGAAAKQKVLLLGASGFIGSAVLAQLRQTHDVITAGRRQGSHDIFLDLNQDSSGSIAGQGFSALVHCAGVTNEEMGRDAEGAWRRTTVLLPALIEGLIEGGLRSIIYISTAHVYGKLDGTVTEATRPDPRGNYAMAHYVTEQVVRASACGSVILRPSTVYGIAAHFGSFSRYSLIPYAFPYMAVHEQKIALSSTGAQVMNFVDVGQIARHVARFMSDPPGTGTHCYNEAGERHMSVLEYADIVGRRYRMVTGNPCGVEAGSALSGGMSFRYESSLAHDAGVSVEEDATETIKRIIREGEQDG
jgi:UDP-glucose 4-epimerase